MLDRLPEDLLHEVLRRLPRTEARVPAALFSLVLTSRALRHRVHRADEVWADLSRFRFGFAAAPVRETVRHALPEAQIHWTLRWVLPHLAAGARAAYARPTIRPIDAADELSGGSWVGALAPPAALVDFVRLSRVSASLSRLVVALETDVTDIPEPVDALAVPSNERLISPGWGVLDRVERTCGPRLAEWARAAPDRAGEAPGVGVQ